MSIAGKEIVCNQDMDLISIGILDILIIWKRNDPSRYTRGARRIRNRANTVGPLEQLGKWILAW